MSKNGVINVLAILTAAYMKDLPDPTIRLYVEALKDLDDDALEAAAKVTIITNKWFPTIAELRERAILNSLPGGLPPTAEEAWQEIVGQVVSVGRYDQPIFSHQLVSDTLRKVGGFYEVCNSTRIEPLKAAYLKAYAKTIHTLVIEAISVPVSALKELN